MDHISPIVAQFRIQGTPADIRPLGAGLINDTYILRTQSPDTPDYVLQRINHHIFTDVEGLQRNIMAQHTYAANSLPKASPTSTAKSSPSSR